MRIICTHKIIVSTTLLWSRLHFNRLWLQKKKNFFFFLIFLSFLVRSIERITWRLAAAHQAVTCGRLQIFVLPFTHKRLISYLVLFYFIMHKTFLDCQLAVEIISCTSNPVNSSACLWLKHATIDFQLIR